MGPKDGRLPTAGLSFSRMAYGFTVWNAEIKTKANSMAGNLAARLFSRDCGAGKIVYTDMFTDEEGNVVPGMPEI
ncbi:hypothetical protein PO124_30635 [Bacillus licheniformis]|nr:hypothetical protein [Bacillus licheniformis]